MSQSPIAIKEAYERVVNDPLSAFLVFPGRLILQVPNDDSAKLLNLIPGSFNPLHKAHLSIYDAALKAFPHRLTSFEISIRRKDKDHLPFEEMEIRVEQFTGIAPVLITNAMLFFEKSGLFCNHVEKPVFHIGYDTAERIVKDHGIAGTQGIFASFYVYNRMQDGKLFCISDWPIRPANFHLGILGCDPIDISSTALRNAKKV